MTGDPVPEPSYTAVFCCACCVLFAIHRLKLRPRSAGTKHVTGFYNLPRLHRRINVQNYEEGHDYELPAGPYPRPDLRAVAIKEGWAEQVEPATSDATATIECRCATRSGVRLMRAMIRCFFGQEYDQPAPALDPTGITRWGTCFELLWSLMPMILILSHGYRQSYSEKFVEACYHANTSLRTSPATTVGRSARLRPFPAASTDDGSTQAARFAPGDRAQTSGFAAPLSNGRHSP